MNNLLFFFKKNCNYQKWGDPTLFWVVVPKNWVHEIYIKFCYYVLVHDCCNKSFMNSILTFLTWFRLVYSLNFHTQRKLLKMLITLISVISFQSRELISKFVLTTTVKNHFVFTVWKYVYNRLKSYTQIYKPFSKNMTHITLTL